MSELLTVREVASVLKCSEDAVTRRFAKLPGVIDLGQAETRNRRRYRVLRIPKSVVEAYLSKKAGHTIPVEVPPRPERRRRSDNWLNKAVTDLAKAGLQNECMDRGVYRRIAERAAFLVRCNALPEPRRVPESMWPEIEWDVVEDDEPPEDFEY